MTREEREDAINCFKNKLENEVYGAKYNKLAIEALEQEPTIKNDLGVDCISRSRAIERLKLNFPISDGADNSRDRHRYMQALADIQALRELPSVTPQEPQSFKWCTDCKEYDQEKHCCHRWSKVIRNTVEEMKQEYIEREVLDKIRAQLKSHLRGVEITLEVLVESDPLRPKMEGAKDTLEDCLELIDKAETEKQENGSENNHHASNS